MEDLEIPKLLEDFLAVYPEFAPIYTTQEQIDRFELLAEKIKCIYPRFKNAEKCSDKFPYFMLVAHYIVMNGEAKSIGILPSSGIKSSSSVGDVSVVGKSANNAKGEVFFLEGRPDNEGTLRGRSDI